MVNEEGKQIHELWTKFLAIESDFNNHVDAAVAKLDELVAFVTGQARPKAVVIIQEDPDPIQPVIETEPQPTSAIIGVQQDAGVGVIAPEIPYNPNPLVGDTTQGEA